MAVRPDVTIEWEATEPLPEPTLMERLRGLIAGSDVDGLNFDADDLWMSKRCVYAYVDPDDEVVYVGKSWGVAVFDRFNAPDKDKLWQYLDREHGVRQHEIDVLVGTPVLHSHGRLTSELLADVESLLIYQLEPVGNVQSVGSRVSRPGMVVRCEGDWPLKRMTFIDEE